MTIHEMNIGDAVEGYYLLQSAVAKETGAGKPYLLMSLADCTGAIDAQIWNYAGPVTPRGIGGAVYVKGMVSEYRGLPQVTVDALRLADENDRFDPAALVPAAPIDPEKTWNEISALVDSIADPDYAGICREMLRRYGDRFREIPAAKSVHHAFLNGLLMHTANMLRAADFMSGVYSEVIDRSLLLTGTLLHDFAKAEEFVFSPLGVAVDYSVKGELLGHLVMGAQEVAKIAAEQNVPEEKSVLLQHLLLSHHGEPEYGAAVRPVCAEGELLSYLDMIDSRMEIYRETYQEVPAGQFSRRIFALDRRVYHHN